MIDMLITIDSTIRQAMKGLDKALEKCLLVVDDNQNLLGTLTDGDLRRSILNGANVSETIEKYYFRDPITLYKGNYTIEDATRLLREKKIEIIPILDKTKKIVDYLTWANIKGENKNKKIMDDISVVIMAGGKGSRMEPFTSVLPKPLIPINEKTIIEHIIERFTDMGCSDFHLTVNYKSKILKAYFEELKPHYSVSFISEDKPLGTAGSLQYLNGKFDKSFFVTNCDILIKSDYLNLHDFHNSGGYDLTLVASSKEYVIPYGTCELNSRGYLSHINEKPIFNFLINTGLYILNPDVLNIIPKNKFYHITDLIKDLKKSGKKVGVFPIDDDAWIDIGQWEEYKKVMKLL
jgi:dTDP-glucose pyrophosphorylase